MTTEFRQRILGDVDASAPARWSWGGPDTQSIDLALLLYASDESALNALRAEEEAAWLAAGGVTLVERADSAALYEITACH